MNIFQLFWFSELDKVYFIKDNKKTLLMLAKNLQYFAYNIIKEKNETIYNYFVRLDKLNIQKVLKRGFAIVRDARQKDSKN